MHRSEVYPDAASAIDVLRFAGMTIKAGAFGLWSNPEPLVSAIKNARVKNLATFSNSFGALQTKLASDVKAPEVRAKADAEALRSGP